ncbi:gluconate 2-dehydrogenase subunit 3 family protein [Candidatus Halobonum tyrrellensis]|uniref:Gluconate 2-dehydrogenase subunit 3 family protein n=1 Tax=Candidatus Halobonum tyrrellensis G22 TaxID=1324957 RepID=V4HJ77_9EURY|nr:gluconate 2-dehydrogenase subunit 3 family protein [Candidatus Halobonum tyrrellensis]ESP89803.1 hypothetical protein K933_02431 [Candidatus Halobonum tyrrellensis G22]
MELDRRDLLTALAATGAGSTAGCSSTRRQATDGGDVSDHDADTLVALAEVLYPSSVSNVGEFVREYSLERVAADAEYAAGVAEAVGSLDEYVSEWHDVPYAELPTVERGEILRHMTVDTADPDPDGVARERIRYYLVNELLYAFYTTPTGAGLVGLENPPGHPGGTRSYRRGPDS